MPATINSGTNGDLNTGNDGSGPVATAVGIVRKTVLTTSLGDALSCQITYGWDQVSGEARIVLPTETGGIGDGVSITMGCNPGNVAQRFSGTLVSFDTISAPHTVTALCKGPLYALEEYTNSTETINAGDGLGRPGLAFADLVGGIEGATLNQIVQAVLQVVGVNYSAGNLEDPGHIYGLFADEEFTWGTYETASAYIHRVLEASAGYRLFDSADGNVYLKQITAIAGAADLTFTVGKDIFGDSQKTSSRIGRRSAVLVEGYDDGKTGVVTSNPSGNSLGPSVFHISSTLIEDNDFAAELAAFWLPQVDRLQEIVRLHTPSDAVIGPAQTHQIDGIAADTMWVKSVTTEIDAGGAFSQHPVYVSGT